jgi:hypothetical protein
MKSSQAVALLSVLILSTGCATTSRHSAPEGSKSSRFDCDQSADLPGSCFAQLGEPEAEGSDS